MSNLNEGSWGGAGVQVSAATIAARNQQSTVAMTSSASLGTRYAVGDRVYEVDGGNALVDARTHVSGVLRDHVAALQALGCVLS